ncbi:MAG: hypothetical protein U5L96_10740 [Owenweeksia sp.]|nr:hypothetical protein [Owenweeksia sp.]
MIYQEYYSELGKLLYAIAMADGRIQDKESLQLHQVVKDELTALEDSKDEFNTDAAYITEFEFDVLQEQALSMNDAYQSFVDYIQANPEIPPRFKRLAYRAACKVADSFHNTNKQESEMLGKLKELLREPMGSANGE